MSGVLFIGDGELQAIAQAIELAKAKPLPWSVGRAIMIDDRDNPKHTLTLQERNRIGAERLAKVRREYPSQVVQLGTYTAALSFEEQPDGMMRHLSIASRAPGKAPNEHVVKMVVEAFGFSCWPPKHPYRVWVEEYEVGRIAINLAELEQA